MSSTLELQRPLKPKSRYHRNRRPKQKQQQQQQQQEGGEGATKERQSPKVFEINKLIKKFPPTSVNGVAIESLSIPLVDYIKKNDDQEIYLVLHIVPSDPFFPYELESLKISLFIPLSYPKYQPKNKATKPSIVVLNKDIPRGYSVNIELGFNEIIEKCIEQKLKRKKRNNKTTTKKEDENQPKDEAESIELVLGTDLFSIISTLDKYLDEFLSREKKETIKIVRHKKPTKATSAATSSQSSQQKPDVLVKLIRQPNIRIPTEISELRSKEIHKLLKRLETQCNIRKFKSTEYNDIYSMTLPFINEIETRGLVIEFDLTMPPLIIESLPCRLHIPKEYLYSEKKAIKLEVDKNFMVKSVAKYDDNFQKLEISKRVNSMINNFNNVVSPKFLAENLQSLHDLKHSLTSQLNFFIYNSNMIITGDFKFLTI